MNTFISIIFFVWFIKLILQWVAVWQLKEYRMDRMLVHIRETHQGRQLLFSWSNFILGVVLLSYIFVILFDWYDTVFQLEVILLGCLQVLLFGKHILSRTIKRPILTVKAVGILILSVLLALVLLVIPLTEISVWVILETFFIPCIVGFFIFLFAFPTEVYTDLLVEKARKKILSLKQVRVIAVSGSYGKSSTKEGIAHILSQKYQVIKTPLSNNTPIAIAKTVLSLVNKDTDFFVVEMGAYKKGEIAQLSYMVRPTISVTTAISDQHISLYGNFDNIILSEKELFSALPKSGLAIVNGENTYLREIAEDLKQQTILYRLQPDMPKRFRGIMAYDSTATENGTQFSIKFKKFSFRLHSPLLGLHTVENLLPGVLLGLLFSIPVETIQQAVSTMQPLPNTMAKIDGNKGIRGIDDTFNASPESVFAALNYLSLSKKKKIVVLTPLIELGKYAKIRHKEIAQRMREIGCSDLFLTNTNFLTIFREELHGSQVKIHTGNYLTIAHAVKKIATKNSIILFEGKEAGIVLSKI